MDTVNTVLLHLSLVPGVGPGAIQKILPFIAQGFNAYKATAGDFMRCGLTHALAARVVEGLNDETLLSRELMLIDKHAISWCTVLDESYPSLLKAIHIPPVVLYVRGLMEFPENSIALVGSRAANQYGKIVVQSLVPELVSGGWCIVSGGAYGVDTYSHRSALDAGGKTIVVLGAGLLCPYLLENRKLFESIVKQGGMLVSSFPLKEPGSAGNFPARNRIIAGLCKGVIVVQAAHKSGALITAKYALDEGRSVFAVPGPVNDPLSYGCHELIKQGARLVSSGDDIMQEFGIADNRAIISPARQTTFLDEDEDLVVRSCKIPQSIDQLIELTGISSQELSNRLFELQLEGRIEQNFAGLWERV